MWIGDFVLITHSTFQPLLGQVKGQPYKLKNLHTQPSVEKYTMKAEDNPSPCTNDHLRLAHWKQTALTRNSYVQYVSLSPCHLTASRLWLKLDNNEQQASQDRTQLESTRILDSSLYLFVKAKSINNLQSWFPILVTRIEQTTHQKFGTHADSPRSSLWFSDSRYHNSTPFCSWCTQNIRCSVRCSSLGSPSPDSPPQPLEQFPRRKTLNIHKRQTQDALSAIHALPWRKLFLRLLGPHTPAGECLFPFGWCLKPNYTIKTLLVLSI